MQNYGMQRLTEEVFRRSPPMGLFDDTMVANLFPDHSIGARRALVHRAVSTGEVLRLKPGLYCLEARLRSGQPHPFVVAAMLCYPSQVSLETALSYHGLIPEAVREVASVTDGRSRSFTTGLGPFTFTRVPCDDLRAGVKVVEVARGAWAFVATPLRAIADLVYVRREVSWARDGLSFLTESMRIEREDLEALSLDPFDAIHSSLRSRRTLRYLEGLGEELT
jgi:hypothetical protein